MEARTYPRPDVVWRSIIDRLDFLTAFAINVIGTEAEEPQPEPDQPENQ